MPHKSIVVNSCPHDSVHPPIVAQKHYLQWKTHSKGALLPLSVVEVEILLSVYWFQSRNVLLDPIKLLSKCIHQKLKKVLNNLHIRAAN